MNATTIEFCFRSHFDDSSTKTQVFPLSGDDHIHNRLTHSLEVASVGRTLGKEVAVALKERERELEVDPHDVGSIVSAACLMHDIGNPPFGHAGEDAIGSWFRMQLDDADSLLNKLALSEAQRTDLCHFEGNAQAFRIAARLALYRNRGGMQLTLATLGAVSKYPQSSLYRKKRHPSWGEHVGRKKFGFFEADKELFAGVASDLGLVQIEPDPYAWSRHPLSYLVEAADDICYGILDVEDGFLLGYVDYATTRKLFSDLAQSTPSMEYRRREDEIGYLRAKAISRLVREVTQQFCLHEEQLLTGSLAKPLTALIESRKEVADLNELAFKRCYRANEVVRIELAGYRVIGGLLELFVPAVTASQPTDYQEKLRQIMDYRADDVSSPYDALLLVTDFISGMTDSYALRMYRELTGIALPEIVSHRGER